MTINLSAQMQDAIASLHAHAKALTSTPHVSAALVADREADYPWTATIDQWRNEALLSGVWISLTKGGIEITGRQHTRVRLEKQPNTLLFAGVLSWAGTFSADGLAVWLLEDGGDPIHVPFIEATVSNGAFHVPLGEFYIRLR